MEEALTIVVNHTLRGIRYLWGTLNEPYRTYRYLVDHGRVSDTVPLVILIGLYFSLAAPLRAHTLHPLFLTYNFGLLATGALLTFLLVVLGIYIVGKVIGGRGTIREVMLAWSFSLLPTLLWFLLTSFSYIVLPPPRTLSPSGKLFSVFFVTLSLALFFWKGILYYLTLRFALRLDLPKIFLSSIILLPLGALYAIIMYTLGIFRIPFI